MQERKKENRSAALGDAVRFLSFAESVGWAFPACSRNEVRREACPFSAEYQGKEKPRSMVTHGEVFFSSFSAGKHSGLSPKYEILRLACHCELASSKSQARAIGKPYFIARKVFSTRSSTFVRLNASPSRNFAHVRMICNVTRARSSFGHGLAGGLLIGGDGLPFGVPAETQAAQRASTRGISAPACQERQLRRALRSRME